MGSHRQDHQRGDDRHNDLGHHEDCPENQRGQNHRRQQLRRDSQRIAGRQRFPEQDATVLAVVVQRAQKVEKDHKGEHQSEEQRRAQHDFLGVGGTKFNRLLGQQAHRLTEGIQLVVKVRGGEN